MNPSQRNRRRRSMSRGFSLIEMLVALTISATLLTATMVALDTSFKSYKVTSESVSTHVVGRLVMQRLTALIRTGENFGPFPVNPIIDPRIESTSIEFELIPDPFSNARQVWRIERVDAPGPTGPFELQATVEQYEGSTLVETSTRTLVRRVEDAMFTLEYDVGPRLTRATIDLTLRPDDTQADSMVGELRAPFVRLVTSIAPRRLD